MGENYNPEEYNEYLEWRREREETSLKAGDSVRVPRSDGTVDESEDGWKIKFIFPDEKGEQIASLQNKERGLAKEIPLETLAKHNER
ncbi:MAG: hypothetical protein PHT36_00580 [Patescibacteria group bacterium]|nr:hypothetical protein [Patescibacteria group bacterium]